MQIVPRRDTPGAIEIEVNGARIRVEPGGGCSDALYGPVGAQRRSMIALRPGLKLVVATQPVDFRKSVHTLSALVREALRANRSGLAAVIRAARNLGVHRAHILSGYRQRSMPA
jgi:hypothetical protein